MPEFPPIQDIAAPVEPVTQAGTAWGWWIAAVVLGLVILVSFFLWLRAFRRRVRLPALPSNPEKAALRELEALRGQADTLAPEEFATELSGVVRIFLQRQTGVLALYATSPEILGDRPRAGDPPPPPAIAAFREVLQASDALKYGAPHADLAHRTRELIDSAIHAVRLAALPPEMPV
ncbi:MAG: DUF4381 family protein [Verrucomicrobiota bacterium]